MTHTRSIGARQWWSTAAFLLMWAGLSWYLFSRLNRGWVPHDEGAFGQSAERLLMGEVPHRDFDELYTGGLTFLHSLAMRVFGTRLISMRYLLFGFAVVWIPVLWWIVRRFASWSVAAVVTVTSLVWTIPNYPAAVPSWYNLILSTVVVAALYRFAATGRGSWLFLAGIVGGLSATFKITGGLVVVAGGLWLLYRDSATPPISARRTSLGLVGLVALATIVGTAQLLGFWTMSLSTMLNLFVPVMAVAVAVVWRRWHSPARFPWRELGTLGLGTLVPIALLVGAFAYVGALPELFRGVIVAPLVRLTVATYPGPSVAAIPAALLLTLLAFMVVRLTDRDRGWAAVGITVIGAVGLTTMDGTEAYWILWHAVRWMLPTLAILAVGLMIKGVVAGDNQFLLVAAMALTALNQFPFSAPIYFLYVVTLGFLVVVALAAASPRPAWQPLLTTYLILAGFGVMWLNTGFLYTLGARYERYEASLRLDTPRAGILIPTADEDYNDLINFVVSRADSEFILAGPDSPEVYFLTGKRNPTRVLFEALSPMAMPTGEMTLRLLNEHGINIVVVNTRPGFSGQMSAPVLDVLSTAYPNNQQIGKFLVLWRDTSA